MSIKDHPLFFTVAACAATAAATWVTSEQVRVTPLKEKVAEQQQDAKASPVIKDITVTRSVQNGQLVLQQNISFSDPEGDAVFMNFVVAQTDAPELYVQSASIKASAESQTKGAVHIGQWQCGTGKYYVKKRLIISDRAGNLSRHKDYVLNCDA